MEEINYKEKVRKAIKDYIIKNKQVKVENIIQNAGAEKLRVYPILFELEQEGFIYILETEDMGAPKLIQIV